MPRKLDTDWDELIFTLTRENPKIGPKRIFDRIKAEAAKGKGLGSIVSERTIARRQRWFREQDEEFQVPYGRVYWPESFEQGLLPWDAAQGVLQLLRFTWPKRPLVGFATAWWKVKSTRPELDVRLAIHYAHQLTGKGPNSVGRRTAEEWLISDGRPGLWREQPQQRDLELAIKMATSPNLVALYTADEFRSYAKQLYPNLSEEDSGDEATTNDHAG
ncbi:MAG: hypothetical protein AB7J35_00050 [Dehalococcoidia bacterium]